MNWFSNEDVSRNAMQCICTLIYLTTNRQPPAGCTHSKRWAMRLEVKEGDHGCLIINDTLLPDLNSLSIALSFLNQQSTRNNLSRTVILSDILQSGHSSEELYELVARLMYSQKTFTG